MPHESDLHAYARLGYRIQQFACVGEVQRKRLLAKNVFADSGDGLDRRRMKLIGCGDDDGIEPFASQHGFQAAVRILDFEFRGDLAGAFGGHIGYRHELGLRHQPAKILGVASPHFSYP
jgi:hypothetical protein